MTQANELRIGNYLMVKYVGTQPLLADKAEPQPINTVNIHAIAIGETDFEYLPIPLTPEILEACGLEVSALTIKGKDPIRIWMMPYLRPDETTYRLRIVMVPEFGDKPGFTFAIDHIKHNERIGITTVQYLHQFQNLYFDLTGKELTVSL